MAIVRNLQIEKTSNISDYLGRGKLWRRDRLVTALLGEVTSGLDVQPTVALGQEPALLGQRCRRGSRRMVEGAEPLLVTLLEQPGLRMLNGRDTIN